MKVWKGAFNFPFKLRETLSQSRIDAYVMNAGREFGNGGMTLDRLSLLWDGELIILFFSSTVLCLVFSFSSPFPFFNSFRPSGYALETISLTIMIPFLVLLLFSTPTNNDLPIYSYYFYFYFYCSYYGGKIFFRNWIWNDTRERINLIGGNK